MGDWLGLLCGKGSEINTVLPQQQFLGTSLYETNDLVQSPVVFHKIGYYSHSMLNVKNGISQLSSL